MNGKTLFSSSTKKRLESTDFKEEKFLKSKVRPLSLLETVSETPSVIFMTDDETNVNIICPSEDELLNYKLTATTQCPVCSKEIKNPSAMRMHMAQTHALGTEHVLQSYNKAFSKSNKAVKSFYACPAFNCSRTYKTGRYFKCLSTLREVCFIFCRISFYQRQNSCIKAPAFTVYLCIFASLANRSESLK